MNGNGHKVPAPSTVVTMTITFDQVTGQVLVNGPIQNEMLALYMLEKARDGVKDFIRQQMTGQKILPATALQFLKQ